MSNIEINSTPSRVQYTATSSQTEFSVPFPFNTDSDLKVYQRTAGSTAVDATDLLTITTEYTLTGAGAADGGTMTLVTGATTGDIVTIVGDDPIDRDTIINTPTKLTNTTLNTQFNNLTIYAKQLETQMNQLMMRYNNNEAVDSGYLVDNVVPYLTAGGIWRKNDGNTAIEVATIPTYPVGSTGSAFSTDNVMVKTDTSGTYNNVQETGISVDDSNNVTGVAGLTATGTLIASGLTYPTSDGAAGYALKTDGAGTLTFSNSGDGDVDGPASSTDNAYARFDTATGKLLQNSLTTEDDSGNITTTGSLTMGSYIDMNLNAIRFDDNTGIHDENDNELLIFQRDATAANHIEVTSNRAGVPPILGSAGSDTNVGLFLNTKGSGSITLNASTTLANNVTQSGGFTANFSGTTTFQITHSTSPTMTAGGQIAIDSTVTDFSAGVLEYYSGEVMGVVAMPIAQFTTPTDGNVVAYNATNDEFELVAQSGGISAVVDDTTPQLGGDLDANGFNMSFDDATGIVDENGNELLWFQTTASAVNYLEVQNSGSGSSPILRATGSDPNIGLQFVAKGSGNFTFSDAIQSVDITIVVGDLSLTSGNVEVSSGAGIQDSNANELLLFTETASAVNYVNITNSITANGPTIASAGDDANIDLVITAKGTGQIELNTTVNGPSAKAVDFGSASSFKITRSATPTLAADGQIAVDTSVTDFSHGVLKYYGGEEMGVVSMPIAQFTSPTDGYVVSYNATNDEFELVTNGVGTAATQSDQETATSTNTYVSPGRQQYHPSAAKFWCEFDCITTTAINSSYNTTSVTDNGTGDTTVTIATDFSSANWCVVSSSAFDDNAPGAGNGIRNDMVNSFAVGSIRVGTVNSSSTALDVQHVSVVGFGDQ